MFALTVVCSCPLVGGFVWFFDGYSKRCDFTGTLDSPEWRKGPSGPKTLCNACGCSFSPPASASIYSSKKPHANSSTTHCSTMGQKREETHRQHHPRRRHGSSSPAKSDRAGQHRLELVPGSLFSLGSVCAAPHTFWPFCSEYCEVRWT